MKRWGCVLLLLAGCGGELAPTATTSSALCPDLRINRTWSEPDVSRLAPMDHNGATYAVTAHHLSFMRRWNAEGTLTEIWSLADGAHLEQADAFLACDGALSVRSETRPYAIASDVLTVDGVAFVAD